MDALTTGTVTLLNGLWTIASTAMDLRVAGLGMLIASSLWLAQLEVDELDRLGTKPVVGRH